MPKDNISAVRDKVASELEHMQADLGQLQEQARAITEANEQRAAVVERIQSMKRDIAAKADEYGELARAASLIAGGTNHRPLR